MSDVKTPAYTLDGLDLAIAEATPQSRTGAKFISVDSRVLEWLIHDARLAHANKAKAEAEATANARLIAAAPQLLRVAKAALDWFIATGAGRSLRPALWDAIAKAEGWPKRDAKHTPGPWVWKASAGMIANADGRIVIDVSPVMSLEEADARLIAAAPDLLYALEELLAHADFVGIAPHYEELARAAIAKAEGRSDA